MRKIEYTFITLARQFLFISIFIYVLLHLSVVTEILVFKIDKYYQAFNFPITYLIYGLIVLLIGCLFFQHRFFYAEYTKSTLTYTNKVFHKSRSIDFDNVDNVICDTFGAYFFNKGSVSREKKDADFVLPFFRGGRIDVVQLNKMLDYMSSHGINVTKTYKIMPGYGKKTKILSFVYGFFAIAIIANCANPIYTVIVLLQAHL